MIIDDAWAEQELEQQLRALTPIVCLEDAEHKLTLSYNATTENFSSCAGEVEEEEEECLPDSVEVFLSLIQAASNAVELELAECKTLIEQQIVVRTRRESEDSESVTSREESVTSPEESVTLREEEGEEETVVLTEYLQDQLYETSSPDLQASLPPTRGYQLKVPSDLPIYQIPEAAVLATSRGQVEVEEEERKKRRRREEEEEEEERIGREAVRRERLWEEKRRLEQSQQVELQKIQVEVRLAEEALRIEVVEHEKIMKQLNEEHEVEKKMYEEEMQRREEEIMMKKEQSATKIQAHFRGMRTRREHSEVLGRRVAERKEQLFEEQLQYYEDLITRERAAVEAELETRRQEELEKQRADTRAEEIRERHLEKERCRKREEERRRVEEEEKERRGKREEEERGVMSSQQVLHWVTSNDSGESVLEQKAVDNIMSGSPKSSSPNQKKDGKLVKEKPSTKNGCLEDTNIDNKEEVCKTPFHATDNVQNNLNSDNVENYNVNQGLEVDNRVVTAPDNDNAKKYKPSFLGNIAIRAKNIFKPFSSNELSKEKEVDKEAGRSEEKEVDLKEAGRSEGCETVEHIPQSDSSLHQPIRAQYPYHVMPPVLPDVTRTKPSASNLTPPSTGPPPSPTPAIKQKIPPVSPEEEAITRTSSKMSPQQKTLPLHTLLHKRNPLTLSIDTSLTPHPPPQHKHVSTSLDLAKPSSHAAKAEYRRKRKLRDDLSLARELSNVPKATPPSEPITVDVSWEGFVAEFEGSYSRWRDLNLPWNEYPRPPSTARTRSARSLPNNYSHITPRVVNGTTLIEHYESATVTNPPASEIYVKNCNKVEVLVEGSCDCVRLLSLEHCTNCSLHVSHSSITCLYQNRCGVTELGRVPGGLVVLDVARNNITRLSTLSCSNLLLLTVSHNSLVSTRGLQYLPNLISLDLSFNNLSHVLHLDQCGLLQDLNLSHNQLVSVPNLQNNILLTTLDISANGLTDLTNLTTSWLPCLRKLKLLANGLDSVPLLHKTCPLLSYLDVSNNMLSNTREFTTSLQYCKLEEVVLEGTDLSPHTVYSYVDSMRSVPRPVSKLINFFLEIQNMLPQEMDLSPILATEKVESLRDRQQTAKQIRSDIVSNLLLQSALKVSVAPSAVTNCQTLEDAREDVVTSRVVMETGGVVMETDDVLVTSRDSAILILQSLIRGFKSRLRFKNLCDQRREAMCSVYLEMCRATELIQRVWRGFVVRKLLWDWLPWLHRRHEHATLRDKAAVKIQSVFRGFVLRRRLSEVFQEAEYDISDIADCQNLQGSLDFDEFDCDRGWGLPPTPSLQYHAPLPSASLQHHAPLPSASLQHHAPLPPRSSGQSINMTEGPVPLLPISKLRSRDSSRCHSLRSEISVLSLPPSRRPTPSSVVMVTSRRHEAIATEWGIKNQDTVIKLVQRSKKFGKQISQKKKRELVREKLLEGSRRMSLVERGPHVTHHVTPPPPSADSAMSDCVEYQWDVPSLRHHGNTPRDTPRDTPEKAKYLPTQIYRNPKFNEPANTSLPPLHKTRYTAFR